MHSMDLPARKTESPETAGCSSYDLPHRLLTGREWATLAHQMQYVLRQSGSSLSKRGFAVEACSGAELFLDPEELIVLGDAVRARGRAGFDLAGRGCHGKVGDERVLGFAGAVRNDGVIARRASELDGLDRFRDRPNLIELDENGVGDALFDSTGKDLRVRDEDVVANQLDSFWRTP